MRKFSPHLFLITFALIGVGAFALPQPAHALDVGFDIGNFIFGSMDVIYGLLGKIFWWGAIPLASIVMRLLGGIVDTAISLSFSTSFYDTPAISMAWGILRDLANMLFIFILIYEGIRTVLNIGNMTTVKKTIASVVIAALLLNFSLFFTKVIIDVSNVTASWFAQGIINVGGGSSVSDSVRAAMSMEKLVSMNQTFDGKTLSLQAFTTGFLLTILQIVAIYVFFKVSFLIIGRIVAFMFLLITSPIGFVGMFVDTIPQLSDYAKKWWKELNSQAFMLPLFFLMLYLTVFIVDRVGVFIANSASQGTTSSTDLAGDPTYYLMFIIVIFMLLRALKTAEEYSGEIGTMVAGYLKQAVGFAGGAMVMGTVGRAASALQNSERFKNITANSGMAGRLAMRATKATSGSGFGTGSSFKDLTKGVPMPLGTKDAFNNVDKGFVGMRKAEKDKKKVEVAEQTDNRKMGDVNTRVRTQIQAIKDSEALLATGAITIDDHKKNTANARGEMANAAAALSNKQLENLNKDVIENSHFVQAISQNQVEHLGDKREASDEDKAKTWKTRLEPVFNAAITGAPDAIRAALKNVSDKELENLDFAALDANPNAITSLTQPEAMKYDKFNALIKSSKVNSSMKEKMKSSRYEKLKVAVNTVPPVPTDIIREFSRFTDPIEVVKIGERSILTNQSVIENMSVNILQKMITNDVDESIRNAIRMEIATNPANRTPGSNMYKMNTWLNSASGDIF